MRARYVTTDRVRLLARHLSDREWHVLSTLRTVRVATAAQLEAISFADVSRRQARKTLASMTDRRLIARLPRVVGGVRAGSAGFVYVLDVAGLRLASSSRARRPWPVGTPFLAHSLAITALYASVVAEERTGAVQVQAFRTEPATWRTFLAPGATRVVLKPDAEAILVVGNYEDRWFIEVDRSTESRPTLARKLRRYVDYWQTGREQAATGVFPKVLWIVPDAARHAVLVDEFAKLPVAAWPLFTVAAADETMKRILAGAQP
jgi:Replication-relaxation